MALLDDVTRALRRHSPELLTETLRQLLQSQPTPLSDWRDFSAALAPVYDCATRLGLDPQPLFDAAAQGLPSEIKELAREFARRDDITPQAFGFAVVDTSDGPRYAWDC